MATAAAWRAGPDVGELRASSARRPGPVELSLAGPACLRCGAASQPTRWLACEQRPRRPTPPCCASPTSGSRAGSEAGQRAHPPAAARGGARHGRLRHRRLGTELRQPAPRAGGARHRPGDAIVLDIGGTLAGYCSDTTRTAFVGEPPAISPSSTTCCRRPRPRPARRSPPGWRPRRSTRRRARHRRGRLRRAVHPPHRPRHRHGDARGAVHRGRQRGAAAGG